MHGAMNRNFQQRLKNFSSLSERVPKYPNGAIRAPWIRSNGYNDGQRILLGRRAILDFTSVEFFVPDILLFVGTSVAVSMQKYIGTIIN